MPIYEFECTKCDEIVEILLGINEKAPKKCDCGGKLTKLISLSSFQLKGDGWYSTDYSKKQTTTAMPEPAGQGQDATKQSIEKKDNKAIADSISKDVKKAKKG
jgi:putative FmdB family regulatory protein|tara:strand:- start:117 stop:425 length:309 start_codon:yes stop_codon:yes gene_type:complete